MKREQLFFLGKDGCIRKLNLGQVKNAYGVKASWDRMHCLACDIPLNRGEKEFFEKYGLQPTIFNVANLREYGQVHLYPYYVQVALDRGARDLRDGGEEVLPVKSNDELSIEKIDRILAMKKVQEEQLLTLRQSIIDKNLRT